MSAQPSPAFTDTAENTPPALAATLAALAAILPEASQIGAAPSGELTGRFLGTQITSAFQSLRDPLTGSVVAHEALARSFTRDGDGLSPWRLFADAARLPELVVLDRLCRAIHALNYERLGGARRDALLVLNVHQRLLHTVPAQHGAFFRAILEQLGLPPQRVVIDIARYLDSDTFDLRRFVANYHDQGFQVAVEADSVHEARIYADFVHADWIRITARKLPPVHLPRLVEKLHAGRSKLVVTRVEEPQIVEVFARAGVDLVQGFALDAPANALA